MYVWKARFLISADLNSRAHFFIGWGNPIEEWVLFNRETRIEFLKKPHISSHAGRGSISIARHKACHASRPSSEPPLQLLSQSIMMSIPSFLACRIVFDAIIVLVGA